MALNLKQEIPTMTPKKLQNSILKMLKTAPNGMRKDEIAQALRLPIADTNSVFVGMTASNLITITQSKTFGGKTAYGVVRLVDQSTKPTPAAAYQPLTINWMDVARADGEDHKQCPSLRSGIRHAYRPPMSGMSSQVKGGFL